RPVQSTAFCKNGVITSVFLGVAETAGGFLWLTACAAAPRWALALLNSRYYQSRRGLALISRQQELAQTLGFGLIEQGAGRTFFLDQAIVHEQGVVRDFPREFHFMRDKNHAAAFICQL